MVRNASKALKIGVHLPFGPKFDLANRTFYPEQFRLAYCIFNVREIRKESFSGKAKKINGFLSRVKFV